MSLTTYDGDGFSRQVHTVRGMALHHVLGGRDVSSLPSRDEQTELVPAGRRGDDPDIYQDVLRPFQVALKEF